MPLRSSSKSMEPRLVAGVQRNEVYCVSPAASLPPEMTEVSFTSEVTPVMQFTLTLISAEPQECCRT